MIPPRPVIHDARDDNLRRSSLIEGKAITVGNAAVFARGVVIPDPNNMPGVLLQTVLIPGNATDDGVFIEAVTIPWFEITQIIMKYPDALYRLDPRKWEEMIAGWYKVAGYDEVILTHRSGDLGRDVIAVKKGTLTVRIIDQVKAYAPNRVVLANDVRALLGVLQADQGATKGIVTTTSQFAPKIKDDKFIAPFIPYRLELIDGMELVKRLKLVAGA